MQSGSESGNGGIKMLYKKSEKRIRTSKDCIICPFFDTRLKKCNGIGKECFEYDEKTQTVIDPITKLAIKI